MKHGISHSDMTYIIETLKRFPNIDKAILFGSRAMGNFKKGSDIDIAIVGKHIDFSITSSVKDLLENESPMPYLFDIVDYTHCQSSELIRHIDNFGYPFFTNTKI